MYYEGYLQIIRIDDLRTLQERLAIERISGVKLTSLLVSINLQVKSKTSLNVFDTFHDNIIFSKVSFKIPLPHPYTREAWNYKD